ncbi:MAG: hypothetical protein ACI9VR_000995 [Cognaticolwellia sp.]|jgi:hypothetical protein
MIYLLVVLACKKDPETPAPDLTERLGSGESRAGIVIDPASLFSGISAEGRVGDIKIYNDRVQFILQGDRPGDYYVEQAGGVVDADIVREEEALGRDLVDEMAGMYGLGRMGELRKITIVSDGSDGAAHVRMEGEEGALGLLEGILGEGGVPDLGLEICTDYILEPGSNLMQVRTTLRAAGGEVTLSPGDLLMGSLDAAAQWTPGAGFGEIESDEYPWTGFLGVEGQGAVALVADQGAQLQTDASSQILASLAEMSLGLGERQTIESGEELVFTRYYAVASDLAEISDASLALQGAEVDDYSYTVTAPDGPVAGAWVSVSVDGAAYTVAISNADGEVSFNAPAGAQVQVLAQGRGRGVVRDYAAGAAEYSAYLHPELRESVLSAYTQGAPANVGTLGRGIATAEEPLVLAEPGTLQVQLDTSAPFEVRLSPLNPLPSADPALVLNPNDAVLGWSLDGEITLDLLPGDYQVLAWRGAQHELFEGQVTITAGERADLEISLPQAWSLPDWILADPHSHAGPSADGSCTMEDRLSVSAARGIALHFGTDHDHVADYAPLIDALGLGAHMNTVLASEMSSVPRGHINLYPLELDSSATNGGAFPWWSLPIESTEDQNAQIRDWFPTAVLQYNHPTDSGVAGAAGWSPGKISKPSAWSNDLDAIEVLNSGEWEEYFSLYLDLVNRGVLAAPTGVSDSHGCTSGGLGSNLTFLQMDSDPAAYAPQALREAFQARATVASNGPMILLSEAPGSVLSPGSVSYEVLVPTWIQVDRVLLLEDGELVDTRSDLSGSFELDPVVDASYVVVVEGDGAMSPISSQTPWAATSALLVDVDGGGWEAPLPPFED